ncbi:MAG: hypothetical protein ABI422_07115 [Sphingomicrobium sp.]
MALKRSRWLAELAFAIDEAQRLARKLSLSGNSDAAEIFGRLETIRVEVDLLRRGGWVARSKEIDPMWTGLFPWNRRQAPRPAKGNAPGD